MLGRLLARFRRPMPAPKPAVDPPKSWSGELNDAGVTEAGWIARRRATKSLYVNVDHVRLRRICDEHPHFFQSTIDAANRVLSHTFDLLGSGPFRPDDPDRPAAQSGYQPIDWYLDPVSGLRFHPCVPLAEWNWARHRPEGADIKLPWELSRCQHWAVLGQAYQLTGDERYALEIAAQLRDFMEANPIAIGVNWTCTMDVALRAANWAIGLELVRSCQALTDEFWREGYRALFDHGTFIETHLENFYEVNSNHFFSNVVGLFYLAAIFDDLPRGQLWNRQCRSWLLEEIEKQVLPDGADFESSVAYQRLMTELCLGCGRLADFRGEPLPLRFRARLRRMVEFLAAVQRPDGLMPQIGDADDGRLHIMSGYGTWQPQDARHLFGPAACFFKNGEWTTLAGDDEPWETAWWGFGPDDRPDAAPAPVERLRHFKHAGLTVMREPRHYLIVSNGIVGTNGIGNHKHNDQLGFEFHVDGLPVFVDPGSYVYTPDPDARDFFRGTGCHNTLTVDGQEQNELRAGFLFRVWEKAHPKHLIVRQRSTLVSYRGRHVGYKRLAEPVVHERTYILSRSDCTLTIVDVLKGHGTHRLRWHFHFAPGVQLSNGLHQRLAIRAGAVALEMSVPDGFRPSLGESWYSPSYGVRARCACADVEVEHRLNGKNEYVFKVRPS